MHAILLLKLFKCEIRARVNLDRQGPPPPKQQTKNDKKRFFHPRRIYKLFSKKTNIRKKLTIKTIKDRVRVSVEVSVR